MPNDELGVFEPVTYFSATFAAALVFANPIYLFVLAPIEYVHVDLSKNVEAIVSRWRAWKSIEMGFDTYGQMEARNFLNLEISLHLAA